MPTYSLDASYFEEYNIPIDESEWTRGPQGEFIGVDFAETVQLDPAQLEETSQEVWAALKEAGVTQLRCVYDGGGDEGFAHFDSAWIDGKTLNVNDLATLLPESATSNASEASSHTPETLKDGTRAALDFLAYELASKLLGSSFGTGVEGSMYGAIHVDLMTGKITDDPSGSPQ